MAQVYYTFLESPIGRLFLTIENDHLTNLTMDRQKKRVDIEPEWKEDASGFASIEQQLHEYFEGERQQFDVPLNPRGTAFQKLVWKELQTIPFGSTISYGELATRIAKPKASRAVGMANGQNPLPIIIPCHRVIGANGSLTGFGGGIDNKLFLIELEKKNSFHLQGT